MPTTDITCPICSTDLISQGPSTLKWHQARSQTCKRYWRKSQVPKNYVIPRFCDSSLVDRRMALSAQRLAHLSVRAPKFPQYRVYSEPLWYPIWVVRAWQLGYGPTRIRLLSEDLQHALQMEFV